MQVMCNSHLYFIIFSSSAPGKIYAIAGTLTNRHIFLDYLYPSLYPVDNAVYSLLDKVIVLFTGSQRNHRSKYFFCSTKLEQRILWCYLLPYLKIVWHPSATTQLREKQRKRLGSRISEFSVRNDHHCLLYKMNVFGLLYTWDVKTYFYSADTHCQHVIHWLFTANGQEVGAITTIPSIESIILEPLDHSR